MKKLNPIYFILFSILLVACSSAESGQQTSASSPEIVSPSHAANDANLPPGMVSINYHRSANYARLGWSANYVKAAFLRVPTNYKFADPIPFAQFVGQATNPYAFAPVSNDADLLGKLTDTPLSGNGSLPQNYCRIPRNGVSGQSSEECFASNPNTTPYNYIDVMLPISGPHTHTGLLKFPLPAGQNVFTIYYRDWADHINKKEIKISRHA